MAPCITIMEKEIYYSLPEQQKEDLDGIIRELLEFCQINHIPFFVSCAVENNAEGTEYMNAVYSAQSHALSLTDDRIRKHMLLANKEFDVVPKREILGSPFGIPQGEHTEGE